MQARGDIWIADLARAFAELSPATDREREAIARLLGFQPAPQGEAEPLPVASPSQFPAATPEPAKRQPDGLTVPRVDLGDPQQPPPTVAMAPAAAIPKDQKQLEPTRYEQLPGLTLTAKFALPVTDRARLRRRPPHTSLLPPRSTNAILQALLSRPVPEGQVDIIRSVHLLARQRPPRQLPRSMLRTLRYGAQVLIDRGQGMEPFRRDQAEVADRVIQVVGREHVEVLYFSESPLEGCGPGPAWTWTPYIPPARGTTVLLLSDLGMIGRTPGSWPADFGEFFRRLAAHQCAPIALVPVGPSRWPARPPPLRLVTWDRTTVVPRLAGIS